MEIGAYTFAQTPQLVKWQVRRSGSRNRGREAVAGGPADRLPKGVDPALLALQFAAGDRSARTPGTSPAPCRDEVAEC